MSIFCSRRNYFDQRYSDMSSPSQQLFAQPEELTIRKQSLLILIGKIRPKCHYKIKVLVGIRVGFYERSFLAPHQHRQIWKEPWSRGWLGLGK